MGNLDMRLVMGHPGRFQAVFDGRVPIEGVTPRTSLVPYNDLFRIVPQEDDFDVAELSTTAYLYGLSTGRDWIALPIFSGWAFAAHADTVCNRAAGIESPQDLRGKRVGVPEYPVAAILWIRDALESKFGVRPQDIEWFEQRQVAQSHYRLMGYSAPAEVPVRIMEKGRTLDEALIAGELDAVIRYLPGRPGQRSLQALSEHPAVKWLFPDRKAEGMAFCKAQGFFEPIHLLIMKRAFADQHPWLPARLVEAFGKALPLSSDPNWVVPGSYELSMAEQIEAGGTGFSPVGVRANRKAIDRLLELAHQQRFTLGHAPLTVKDAFHAGTLDS
jgi:4,5-dihydroxyphthalate decarboxylase